MASKKKIKSQSGADESLDELAGDNASLENMSLEELRQYLAERERREGGNVSVTAPVARQSVSNGSANDASSISKAHVDRAHVGKAPEIAGAFTVRRTLAGKKLFIIEQIKFTLFF